MATTLILYSTIDGQTRKICERIRQIIEQAGDRVVVQPIDEANADDLEAADKIIIGASIRYGYHRPGVGAFIARHQALLEQRPNAFFSVNIVARKAEKNRPETNPYVIRFLRTINWQPRLVAVFAGRLDYPSYGPFDRFMIRLIMRITQGPTDPATVIEYTDWAKVEAFAQALCAMTGRASNSPANGGTNGPRPD